MPICKMRLMNLERPELPLTTHILFVTDCDSRLFKRLMFSLVSYNARNINYTQGRTMLQQWFSTELFYYEVPCKEVRGYAEMAQVLAAISIEQ